MPRVSVIIPVYNRAWCILEAVQSVQAQNWRDFELIVVDDGSDDATAALLASCGGLTVIRQERRGVSAARNAGVAASQGGLLAFLDSDDLWEPAKLGVQVRHMDSHPECRICQTQEIWVRKGVRVNPKVRHEKPDGHLFERSLELCLVSPSAVMMRRSLFDQAGGFDESLPACEDYDLWLRIGLRHPVDLIDQPLVIKRGGHPDQLSAAPGLDAHRIRALVNLLGRQALTPEQKSAVMAILEKKCRIYGKGCARRGRVEEARYYEDLAARCAEPFSAGPGLPGGKEETIR